MLSIENNPSAPVETGGTWQLR